MGLSQDDCRVERLPSDLDTNFDWTIRRAPSSGALLLVCISSDIFGVRTHFYRGRTGPCRKDGCEACKRKMSSRWSGYLLAVDVKDRQKVVFEFTPSIAQVLDGTFKTFGTLRGFQLVATRSSNKVNGKVMLQVKGRTDKIEKIPKDEAVWPILSHIWGLSEAAVPDEGFIDLDTLSPAELDDLKLGDAPKRHDTEWMDASLLQNIGRVPDEERPSEISSGGARPPRAPKVTSGNADVPENFKGRDSNNGCT